MTRAIPFVVLAIAFAVAGTAAQQTTVGAWRAAHERQILDELLQLVALPNVAARDDMPRNAEHLATLFEKRGFSVERSSGPGSPVVFASLDVPSPRGSS